MSPPSFVLAAVGDMMSVHPIAACMIDAASVRVLDLLRRADVAIANAEFSAAAPTPDGPVPEIDAGGLWLNAAPDTLADLKALGVTMVSRANNHAADFGVAAMLETDRQLTALGIAHAGTGRTLAEARAAAYVTTRAGRSALISVTDTTPRFAIAGHARHDMRGRPGVNPVRARQIRVLDEEAFEAFVSALDVAARRASGWVNRSPDGSTLYGLGAPLRKGVAPDSVFELSARDVAGNLAQVRAARRRADHVVFALHTHLSRGVIGRPPQSIQDFAHQAIDAGADLVIAHGTHRLGPIEIYRGRPICYGLGNFVCHLRKTEAQPADLFDSVGLDPLTAHPDDLMAEGLYTSTMLDAPAMWESAIVRLTHDEGRRRLELHPIELGRDASGARQGSPRLAGAEAAARIIASAAEQSEPFGTRIADEQGIGVIEYDVTA